MLEGNTMNKVWYLIENIIFDEKVKKISGNCLEGPYLGEVEIYVPPFVDLEGVENGVTIKVLCGPGMTMSLPPQLMGCSKIEVVKNDERINEEDIVDECEVN